MKINILLLLLFVVIIVSCKNDKDSVITASEIFEIEIYNQTDITFNKAKGEYYISSSAGEIYTLDSTFKIIKKTFIEGIEAGSISYDKSSLLISDTLSNRFYRLILPGYKIIDNNFRIIGISANNKSKVVGMTYDNCKDEWIIIQDMVPVRLSIYDGDFHFIKKERLKGATNITSCSSYGGYLYVLDGRSSSIYKINPSDLKVIHSWIIDVEYPEGICFDDNGDIVVLCGSDKKALMFKRELFEL